MSAGRTAVAMHDVFPRNYSVQALESYPLLNPAEKLYQFPARLEEGDRTGTYVRITPGKSPKWVGFFALGFDSSDVANGIYSCPDADCLCVVAGGYGYIVNVANPEQWRQIEQRPVVQVKPVPELKLLLFVGFTSISCLGEANHLWISERLSWEGISVSNIEGEVLHGTGWDAITDREIPFQLDLRTGKSTGGAKPKR